jgi:hypothetical protein
MFQGEGRRQENTSSIVKVIDIYVDFMHFIQYNLIYWNTIY